MWFRNVAAHTRHKMQWCNFFEANHSPILSNVKKNINKYKGKSCMLEKSAGRDRDALSHDLYKDFSIVKWGDWDICLHLNLSSALRFSEKPLPYRDWGPSSKGKRTLGKKTLLCLSILSFYITVASLLLLYFFLGGRNARKGQARSDSRGKKHLKFKFWISVSVGQKHCFFCFWLIFSFGHWKGILNYWMCTTVSKMFFNCYWSF